MNVRRCVCASRDELVCVCARACVLVCAFVCMYVCMRVLVCMRA